MNFETANEIENQIAKWFGIRTHIIIPNVYWSFFPYEADLVVLHKSGYVDEIEIKISRADLLRDKKKRHQHDSDMFRRLWFAIPKAMDSYISDIIDRAGILVVESSGIVRMIKSPKINKFARKFTLEQKYELARLGYLRMWSARLKLMQWKENRDV